MADVISIPLTVDQLSKAQAALKSAPGVTLIGDSKSGSVSSPELDFNYTYDGVNFNMTPTAKRGLARFATDSAIKSRIQELLAS